MTKTKQLIQQQIRDILYAPRYFNQYRITIKDPITGNQAQIDYPDFDKDIDLDEWNEWGCNAPFHDTVIEKACPGYEQLAITIKNIELIASYEY